MQYFSPLESYSPKFLPAYNMLSGMPYIPCFMLALLLLAVAAAARAHKRPTTSPSETTQLTDLCDIRALLAPQSTALPLLLLQRSSPNARLVRAFGITNTFVSSSVDVHAAFTRSARGLIAGNDWERFAQCALLAVDRCLEDTPLGATARFDTLVQNVSLLTILAGLFEVSIYDVAVADLAVVACGINDLWKLSKTPDTLPPHMLADVNARLRAWIPSQPNPVDFIVPAWETMWRVVATTLAYTHADPLAHAALHAFIADPTSAAFAHSTADMPSVDALVTEAIRLHPPTRRISRHVASATPSAAPCVVVADIGALHRDPAVWGADADVYNALRHGQRTPAQTQALLGFGAGTLKCVASRWAPHAAGVIVAALAEKIGEGIEVTEGKKIGGRDGWDDWKVSRRA